MAQEAETRAKNARSKLDAHVRAAEERCFREEAAAKKKAAAAAAKTQTIKLKIDERKQPVAHKACAPQFASTCAI